ncbi:DUF805 domain-containing protein [Brevundimonas sp. DC300-4]|uniref:DUF805 domain-containing protein n=1 Tax=Brevundimonas sp. DC300-4 TaxID=2804594 RepID=UPI003CEB0C80
MPVFRSSVFWGRLSRLPYLLSVLGLSLILLLAQPLLLELPNFIESGRILDSLWRGDYEVYGAATDAAIQQTDYQTARYAAVAALTMALFAAFLILSARRLRDLGRPGLYAWIALVPFVGAQALFAVLIRKRNMASVRPPEPDMNALSGFFSFEGRARCSASAWVAAQAAETLLAARIAGAQTAPCSTPPSPTSAST